MTVAVRAESEPLPDELWAAGKREEAFEAMYRRWYPALVNLCRRNLGGQGDPEAIAQEAFVRAWASLDRFTAARPFWPWVSTIARRLCIDQRRRSGREQYSVYIDVTTGAAEDPPDECAETNEEHRSALLALQLLKPSEQRVITLRDVRGWSYDEIARFEGVTIESIRGSLKRARASLRKSYERVVAGSPAAVVARPWRAIRGLGQRLALHGNALPAGDAVLGVAAAALLLSGPASIAHAATPHATERARVTAAGEGQSTDIARPASASTSSAAVGAGPVVPRGTSSSPDTAADGGSGGGLPLLPPDGADSPEDVSFTWITASPSYEQDGTFFATGTVAKECAYGPCAVLFRSTDRGASWQRLPAVGFTGGRVLPAPDDGQIFVSGAAALLVSEDDGNSFGAAAPVGGPAAVSPTFATDHRVLLGQAPGWEYRDDVEAMRPSGIVVPSTSLFTTPAFSPSYAEDGTIFIGGTSLDGRGRQQSAVFRCTNSVCSQQPALLAGSVGAPDLAVSTGGVVAAWRGSLLFRSVDGGASFAAMALPFDGTVQDVAFDRTGSLLVGVRRLTATGSTGGILRSADGGRTWEHLGAGTRLASGVAALTVTADDRIVAAGSAAAGGGLLCSDDAGGTWRPRCG